MQEGARLPFSLARTHTHAHTWDQHGGNDLGVLQHVDDAALEVFATVSLQVAVGKGEKGGEMRAEEVSESAVSPSKRYHIMYKHLREKQVLQRTGSFLNVCVCCTDGSLRDRRFILVSIQMFGRCAHTLSV